MNKLLDELLKKIENARLIWICGNGGSAATAEHLATDLVKKGYPAFALSSNSSVVTMIANDYGYQYIFSKQLRYCGNSEDLLITISCSGTSKNIKEAIKEANLRNMEIFKFPPFDKSVKDKDYGWLENKHLELAHEVAKAL